MCGVCCLTPHGESPTARATTTQPQAPATSSTAVRAVDEDVEEITKKYGLEAGLFSIFKSKDGGEGGKGKTLQAKDLLAKYGSAYLLTSISLSLVSFGLCYALISAGVDVASLLAKVRCVHCDAVSLVMRGWEVDGEGQELDGVVGGAGVKG